MQKKVIALAVAALASGVAMAQSNVTVYGWLDPEFAAINTGNKTGNHVANLRGMEDGNYGSRLGFTGEEGLGGDLKAVFTTEYGINLNNNINTLNTTAAGNGYASATANNFSSRQTFVGLQSGTFGQLAAGRFQTPGWEFAVASRPWGGIADTQRIMSRITGMNIESGDRISNAVRYTTPTFAGFYAKALWSTDSQDTAVNDTNYVTSGDGVTSTAKGRTGTGYLSADYTWNALNLGAVYRKQMMQDNVTADGGKYEYGLRGSYDFKVVKIGASYQAQHKNTWGSLSTTGQINPVTGSTFRDSKLYGAWATVPVGDKINLSGQYTKTTADNSIGGYGYSFNASYDFSKRTQVYAQYGHYKYNTNNGTVGFGGYSAQVAIEGGTSVNTFGVGMLHKF